MGTCPECKIALRRTGWDKKPELDAATGRIRIYLVSTMECPMCHKAEQTKTCIFDSEGVEDALNSTSDAATGQSTTASQNAETTENTAGQESSE